MTNPYTVLMEVTRTFDLVDLGYKVCPREVMFGGKHGNEWITYSTDQVRDNIDWVSYGLLSMGLKKGDKVATISGSRPEWNFVDMGILQMGIAYT